MTEHNNVDVPLVIEAFELALDPPELFLIAGNVGIKPEHERVAVAKRIRRVTAQPMW